MSWVSLVSSSLCTSLSWAVTQTAAVQRRLKAEPPHWNCSAKNANRSVKSSNFRIACCFFQHFYALWNLIQIATAHGSKNHIRPTSKWQHNLRSSGSQCYERQTCNTFDTFQAICKHPCQKGDNLITCHHEGSGCCQPLAFVITTPK